MLKNKTIHVNLNDLYSRTPESSEANIMDDEEVMAEIQKKLIPGKNTTHIKRLLESNAKIRRNWIENESLRIQDIITRYSPLNDYDMVCGYSKKP